MKTLKIDITKILLLLGIMLLLLFQLIGCDEGGGITIPSGVSELTVSVKSDDAVLDEPAAIVITEAKALIMDVEFEKQSNGKDELHQRGPFVLSFNTNGTIKEMGTQYIIRDNYTKIKFQLHKPEETETPSDPEFKEGTGINQRYSFIIKGTYNGSSFIYKSKQSANIVINFAQTENIDLKKTNVTVLFNKLKWFKNGSVEINPNDAQYAAIIDNNLKNSFSRVFRDDNKDGQPDN
jgi:hypothetical protein